MALAAQLIVDSDERRARDRRTLDAPGTLRDDTQVPRDVIVHDLSAGGFFVETAQPLTIGSTIRIGVAGIAASQAKVMRKAKGGYGCRFDVPLDEAQLARAGEVETIHRLDRLDPLPTPVFPEPVIEPYPVRTRIAILVGSTALLWSAILGGVALVTR